MFSYGCHSIRTHHEQVQTPNPETITRVDFPLNSNSLPQQGGLVDEVEHGVEGHFPLEALQGLQLCQVATLDLEMWE